MPIYSGEPNVSPGTDIQSLRASLPEELGAEAGQALSEGPSAQLYGLGELADAKADTSSRSSLASPYPFGWMMGAKPADQPAADIPTDQARLQVKAAGLDQTITLPDQPTIKAPVLDIMMRRAQADRERAATIARGPDGFVSNALAAGTTFGASILDPLNMAAFSIPVMGEARYAKLLADAGDSIAARAALRAGVGAAQGALGSTALTPLDWLAHTQEGQDYSMADALRSILMGAGQGAAFHAGGGLVGDVYKRLRGRPLNAEAPAAPPAPGQPAAGPGLPPAEPEGPVPPASEAPAAAAPSSFVDAARRAAQASAAEEQGAPNPDLRTPPTVAADLPGRAREDVMRGSVASLINGEPVRAGEHLDVAAKTDPRVAAALDGDETMPPTPRAEPVADPEIHAVVDPVGAVRDDALAQFRAAGLPEDRAQANAVATAQLFATRAARRGLGESPIDLYRAEGLQIRRGKSEAPAEAGVIGFRTAKGSEYAVHDDGTTTRNKSDHTAVGHEQGDVGIKPRSARTVYVDSNASVLSAAGLSGIGEKGARLVIKDGRATFLTWNKAADKWGASPEGRNIPVHDEPAVGRYPLELWKKTDDVPGYEAYSRQHAGNKIVGIDRVPASGPSRAAFEQAGGIRAHGIDWDKAERADEMFANGASNEDVYRETGWYMGPDGKMRFEVPDNDARLMWPEVWPEGWKGDALTLKDVLDAPTLYAAYPHLRDIEISPGVFSRTAKGTYTPPGEEQEALSNKVRGHGGRINLSMGLQGTEALSVLAHEIQHAIQQFEDHAGGARIEEPKLPPAVQQQMDDLERENLRDTVQGRRMGDNRRAAIDSVRGNKRAVLERMHQDAADNYRRLYGEVEARNSQRRLSMSPEERAARAPYETFDVDEDRHLVEPEAAKPDYEQLNRLLDSLNEMVSDPEGARAHNEIAARLAETRARVQSAMNALRQAIPDFEPKDAQSWNAARRDHADLVQQYDAARRETQRVERELHTHDGNRSFDQPATVPTFYSAVERAVTAAKQAKASPEQWAATLKNTPGVKPEEMAWLGLDDWLREQKGPVTREQVADFVRANRIDVQEVMKSEDVGRPLAAKRMPAGYWEIRDPTTNQFVTNIMEPMSEEEALTEARNRLGRNRPTELGNLPKYKQYTLPGAEPGSYRELLLTLPPKGVDEAAAMVRARELANSAGDEWDSLKPSHQSMYLDDARYILGKEGGNYRSSHWEEPNILAHVRFNDRVIDGKKTLFVEEVQSDWHQAGRKKGYQGVVSAEEKALSDERNTLSQEAAEIQLAANRDNYRDYSEDPEWLRRMDRITEINSELAQPFGVSSKVPDAPLKTTWPEFALKRILRYAAENGYEKVAWAPGEVHADRYSLHHQVDRVEYSPATHQLLAYKGRTEVLNKNDVPETGLPDMIGKDAADRILNNPTSKSGSLHSLSGLDLKVGGEGMAGFYDRILPAAANKLVKKFGGKVGQDAVPVQKFDNDEGFIIHDARGNEVRRAIDEDFARQEASRIGGSYSSAARAVDQPVHSLDITPALRQAAVEQGFPLFQKDAAAADQQPRGRITLADSRAIVDFFSGADDSTPMHEIAGHLGLDMLARDAADPRVPQQVKDDFQTTLNWLGAERTEFITPAMHEKFARGVEQYLATGQAPSSALARVFEHFRQWIMAVYRDIKALGVPIPPEIRGVMDRMFATDAEIAEQQGVSRDAAAGTEAPRGEAPATASAFPRSARPPEPNPRTLVKFLKDAGGVKDEAGELRARDLHRRYPGLVNNARGLPLDEARRAAAEAGYLAPPEGVDDGLSYGESAMRQTTPSDLLDAIDNHPSFSVHDEAAVEAMRARRADADWRDLARSRLPRDDPDAIEASHAAESAPEPASVGEPSKALVAAQKALDGIESFYQSMVERGVIPAEVQQASDAAVARITQEAADLREVVTRGIACLIASGA